MGATSSGTSTRLWFGRSPNPSPRSLERISARGTSTGSPSLSAEPENTPAGASRRRSPMVILTAPRESWAMTAALGKATVAPAAGVCRMSLANPSGRRSVMARRDTVTTSPPVANGSGATVTAGVVEACAGAGVGAGLAEVVVPDGYVFCAGAVAASPLPNSFFRNANILGRAGCCSQKMGFPSIREWGFTGGSRTTLSRPGGWAWNIPRDRRPGSDR